MRLVSTATRNPALSTAAAILFVFPSVWVAEVPLIAHHATPLAVDRRNPVTLRGTVSEFLLRSPHATLRVDVRDPAGAFVQWTLEGGSIRGFILTGFTPAVLPPGQAVTVVAYPAVQGDPVGQLSSITLPDGRRYGGGPDPARPGGDD